MIYTFTTEDVKLVEKLIDIKNRGFYVDGNQLTEVYNRVLHKNANPTSCGSCLRQRVQELENALNNFKEKMAIQAAKNEEVNTSKVEENKAPRKAGNKK